MDALNKIRKFEKVRNGIGAIIIGVVFIIISVLAMFAPEQEMGTTTATIVEIQEEYDPTVQETNYHVFVDYPAIGGMYRHVELGSYHTGMKVGDEIEVEYFMDEPGTVQTPGGGFIVYIALVLGVIMLAVGIVQTKKSVHQSPSDLEEYNRVDLSGVSEADIERVKNDPSPMNRYYFHFAGHLNQDYELEDTAHRVVYEARMEKLELIRDTTYHFINHITHTEDVRKISHTVSVHTGGGSGQFCYRVPIKSSFKVDGVRNWDYLAERGFGFDFRMNGLRPCFDVYHNGVKVADIETSGTNLYDDEESRSFIGKLPVNGLYRVNCKESELDNVFMTCFSIARAIFYEN